MNTHTLTNCNSGSATFSYGDFAIGDFNGDTKLDLAVVAGQGGAGGICILLGNGDGTFQSPFLIDSVVNHGFIRAGDFNHDGKLDLVASDSGGISVLLGNGNGTFQPAITTAFGSYPIFVVGDFNNDGHLDLAAWSLTQVGVLPGKGDGTFGALIPGSFPPNSAAADLNHDGKLDLVSPVTGSGNGGIDVRLGNGDGTFKAPVRYLDPHRPAALVIRDFNGDGNLDVAVANDDGEAFFALFLGNGDGTFQKAQYFQVGLDSTGIAAGDFNGDKKVDVLVMNKQTQNYTVLLNTGK